ncbi:hypothetical protein ACRN9C_17330 [Shewanella frigidimarina]|jgi:hypothetical protein|uniref:integrase n=3 Tax=Shewanellaceae TaxID=267890 RepID=UPI0016045B8C|nr:integrase [Shewanella sp. SR43-8]MBB1323281.1 integrase [Shewanella sp. SR43-8]|tara:strand:+ start:3984 stop:6374 length:2391 start_codon:yes stop_codon:yes gene_type:complete
MPEKLIECIVNKSKTLSELTNAELKELYNASIENNDFRALRIATNNVTGIYDYDERKPYWLLNDFIAPQWHIEIKDNGTSYKRFIDWSAVTLSDGKKLTHSSHSPLLRAFKYWITATDNPRENAGKFKKGISVNIGILLIISLINSILIHSEASNLTEQHLSGLSSDFFMDLMIKYGESGTLNGLYDYTNKVRKFLIEKVSCVSDHEAKLFSKDYPYLSRSLLPDESVLNFSDCDRVKVCCWLNKNGYYQSTINSTKLGLFTRKHLQGNPHVLHSLIYGGKIIPVANKGIATFDELQLVKIDGVKEFKAIPCVEESEMMSEVSLRNILGALMLLNTVQGRYDVSQLPPQVLNDITLSRVSKHIKLRRKGRYATLPPQLVFNLIESCFEFCYEHQDSILNSMLLVLTIGRTKSSAKNSNNKNYYGKNQKSRPKLSSSERGAWVISDAMKLVDMKLIKKGVKRLSLPYNDGMFIKMRNNESLFSLYDVLMGSIQILTGAVMAKRIDELIKLKDHGNLYPNINPFSDIGENTDYDLISYLKKSGNGGKHGMNAKIRRPIPRSVAKIIWKLERFNQAISKAALNKSELSLFNNVNTQEFIVNKITKLSYYKHVDVACDYFETPIVTLENSEQRRYYIRQHQLRRFFAMVFFWSKSFDGLDTLRWMLGHTDMQHLYNYITESETGAVLNGVKASYIIDAIQKNKLDNIQQLADVIAEHYGVHSANISLSAITDAAIDYEDSNCYKTEPHIEQIKLQENMEFQILELLDDGVISLEPEFFTIEHDGHKINDFSLTLRVKKLD